MIHKYLPTCVYLDIVNILHCAVWGFEVGRGYGKNIITHDVGGMGVSQIMIYSDD